MLACVGATYSFNKSFNASATCNINIIKFYQNSIYKP